MSANPSQRQASWKHSVAGGVAGSVAVVLLHPFDVIKTRLQVQDGHQSQQATYRGALDAARSMYRREGLRAFYNGLTPAWLGSGVAWAAYFYTYESIKGLYLAWHGGDRLGTVWNTVSAAQAGALVCLMTNPIWLIKTRLQLQQKLQPGAAAFSLVNSNVAAPAAAAAAGAQGGSSKAAAALSQQAGMRVAGAAGPGPSSAAAAEAAAALRSGAGTAAAAAAAAARSAGSPVHYRGFVDAFVRIGREEGFRGYYKGLGPSLVLTGHGAIQFTVYEELKHLMRVLPALDLSPTTSSSSSSPASSSTSSEAGLHHSAGTGAAGDSHSSQITSSPQSSSFPASTWPSEGSGSGGAGSAHHNSTQRHLSPLETSVCAMVSKLSASVITYPSQVIRSRLQQRFDDRNLVYKGTLETVALTWRNEGLRGFYRGLGPALLRTLPQSALTLTVYENVLRLMP